jgi:integrase
MERKPRTHDHIYRRPDKPGGTYYIDYTNAEGVRDRRSLETTLLREAKERRDDIIAGKVELKWGKRRKDCRVDAFWKIDKDDPTNPAKDTGKYIAWARRHKSVQSVARERINWVQFLDYAKPKKLGDVTSAKVEKFKDHLTDKRKQEARTVNDAIVRLGALWNHAGKKNLKIYGGPNPFAEVKRLPVDEEAIRYFTQDEIDRIMVEAEDFNEEVYLFSAMAIFTGMRKAEADNAEWHWFDFQQGIVRIQNAAGRFSTKNRKVRSVPLHARLRAILEPFATAREYKGYVIHPEKAERGRWRYRYEVKKSFAYVVKAAGVEWANPHNCRHTFASRLVQEGVSIYKVSQWLGHASVKTTERLYAGLAPRDKDIDRF